ncbi:uncharacterized protein LOC124160171 [Ischnura elegans]|uniref:uncharacterized protein LOC124160171 n=1 Tax=Ischnura elegans TaxID=197161 RepID=UPI001ED8A886|nr:uncharacterized protein LOC124160171 [Ischnura elegans]
MEGTNYYHNYVVDGVVYQVHGSHVFHQELQSDPERAAKILCNHLGSLEAHPVQAEADLQDAKEWDGKKILMMLEEYRERLGRFRDPKVKKTDLWKEIALVFSRSGMTTITHDLLDRKFRNLKRTFLKVKQTKNSTGRNAVNWPYYDLMTGIMTNDETVNIPEMVGTGVRAEESVAAASASSEVLGGHGPLLSTPPALPSRWKRLAERRNVNEELERKRVEALNAIAEQLKESNNIQKERNELLREYLSNGRQT